MIQIILLLGLGLIAGVVSSMLGVGGGIILVPILILLMKLDPHQAIGTSLAIIIPTVLVVSASNCNKDDIWELIWGYEKMKSEKMKNRK